MDRVYLMVLAMLAFAVPAYFVTRVKLSMGEKGEPQTYYDAVAYMRASLKPQQRTSTSRC